MPTDPIEAAVAEFYRQAAASDCGAGELDCTYGRDFVAEMMRPAIAEYLRARAETLPCGAQRLFAKALAAEVERG